MAALEIWKVGDKCGENCRELLTFISLKCLFQNTLRSMLTCRGLQENVSNPCTHTLALPRTELLDYF